MDLNPCGFWSKNVVHNFGYVEFFPGLQGQLIPMAIPLSLHKLDEHVTRINKLRQRSPKKKMHVTLEMPKQVVIITSHISWPNIIMNVMLEFHLSEENMNFRKILVFRRCNFL